MKKSEIETIITATPEAIFKEDVKSAWRNFIIVGFEQVKKNHYTAPVTVALVKDVWCAAPTMELHISDKVRKQPLRTIIATNSSSPQAFQSLKIAQAERKKNAEKRYKQQQELMNDIKPELNAALKACGVDNKAWNFSDTTFKIEVDLDNAEQLLKILQSFAILTA